MYVKKIIKQILPKSILERIKRAISTGEEQLCIRSIRRAIAEQEWRGLYKQLFRFVPDITDQESTSTIEGEYLTIKVRALHAFQICLVGDAITLLDNIGEKNRTFTIVDVGDSAGTHIQYIKGFFHKRIQRCLSINIDSQAIERIRNKGLEAVCARAENLTDLSIDADIFLSFEMLEHLMDPCGFLHSLSENTNCRTFVVTVPYLTHSRVGLQHIRWGEKHSVLPENMAHIEKVHIFELSPEDWKLVFKHSGWKVALEKIYRQYPQRSLWAFLLKRYWRGFDYEGFYGAVLVRDRSFSKLYNGWVSAEESGRGRFRMSYRGRRENNKDFNGETSSSKKCWKG